MDNVITVSMDSLRALQLWCFQIYSLVRPIVKSLLRIEMSFLQSETLFSNTMCILKLFVCHSALIALLYIHVHRYLIFEHLLVGKNYSVLYSKSDLIQDRQYAAIGVTLTDNVYMVVRCSTLM